MNGRQIYNPNIQTHTETDVFLEEFYPGYVDPTQQPMYAGDTEIGQLVPNKNLSQSQNQSTVNKLNSKEINKTMPEISQSEIQQITVPIKIEIQLQLSIKVNQ